MEKHGGRWTAEDNAYGKGKTDCERLIYEWGPAHGVECISSCPSVVMGPLLSPAHDMTWQHRVGEMFAGKYATDWMWNVRRKTNRCLLGLPCCCPSCQP